MSPSDWIAAGALGLTILGCATGYGMLRQRVKDLEKAREEDRSAHGKLETRVTAAESAASAVTGLAAAIESMGEKFSLEVKHLVEKLGLETGHIREQLTDLKEEVRRRPKTTRASRKVI